MRHRIKNRLHYLRQLPPEDRLRTASSVVMIGGVAMLFLWLFLLLPIQLYVQVQPDNPREGLVASLLKFRQSDAPLAAENSPPSRTPQVGGVQDEQYRRPLPSGPFFKTAPPAGNIPTPSIGIFPSPLLSPSPTS